ncbi:response regulator transcription factor [Falsarthrobacter nasiphocae]|uniref:DNA-binding response OmpR family regulator n=1 Tax=Falsarthrobacter nasiphocae TaxID=189863 RepID=A0AAE3YGK3_9MICC|nr:response regulator transcription factor [Falsarthrobacter nasiphocae]MDR6891755.1 DNA-binding response OmpR family regulator [Falsarthrobacter nasiphocae]
MTRILIVEDDLSIASFIEKGLRAQGYATLHAGDGRSALVIARYGELDLIILDLGLPVIDGFGVLEQLQAEGIRTPVIVLSARDSLKDRLTGLEGGADDYVVKPFQFAELLARVRLRLRTPEVTRATVLEAAGLTLDLHARTVTDGESDHTLSGREFAILEVFMRHAGQVLTREQLIGHVWGNDEEPSSNIVDVYIRTLRKKIGATRLSTVRGLGYRLQ